MPRHQILSRLAMYFHVAWVEPAREWRDLWFSRKLETHLAIHDQGSPGFSLYTPPRWLPALYKPSFVASFTARQRLLQVQRLLRRRGCEKTVLYLWRPDFGYAIDALTHELSCYHIDDEYTFSTTEQPLGNTEAKLISRVDQVIIHSPALLEKKGHLNRQTLFLPNGVDYRAYATPASEPIDLRGIRRPRIGYVGMIKEQLNLQLMVELAKRHRDWSFVFVGPLGFFQHDRALVDSLTNMPNAYFLGRKPVAELPAYVQHMDTCILCYKVDDYTKFIYPLKLHEYLASGRPVVGAPINTLLQFGHVVLLASTIDEWSTALSVTLNPAMSSTEQVEMRRSVARQYDWNALVFTLVRTLCKRLDEDYLYRLEGMSK
jgi:glycosyltransferase involved in cell wall biosynthesis